MKDQLHLTGITNTSNTWINGRSHNTGIRRRTISNLLSLTSGRRNRRQKYKKIKEKRNKESGGTSDNSRNEELPDMTVVSFTGIPDVHLKIGSLVNFPKSGEQKTENKMDALHGLFVRNEHGPAILMPDGIRKLHNNIQNQIKHQMSIHTTSNLSETNVSKIDTGNEPSVSTVTASLSSMTASLSTMTASTLNEEKTTTTMTASTIDEETTSTTLSTSTLNKETSASTITTIHPTITTTKIIPHSTKQLPKSTKQMPKTSTAKPSTVTYSSVAVTDIPSKNPTNDSVDFDYIDSVDDDGMTFLNNINMDRLGSDTNLPDLHAVIFPSKRTDSKQKLKASQQFCSKIGTGNTGFQCCMKTLACFNSLPENLHETLFHQSETQYDEAERLQLCHKINNALICKGSVLDNQSCEKMIGTMENNMRPEMNELNVFYTQTCSLTGPNVPFTPSIRNTTRHTSHDKGTNTDSGLFSSPIIPFVGGAFAGLFVLVTVLLIIIYCRKRRTKSRSNERDNDTDSNRSRIIRRKSSVYEEIDVNQMVPASRLIKNRKKCSKGEQSESRKLPSAPPADSTGRVENHYYLSPTSSLPEDKSNTENDKSSTNFGYLELQTDENGQSYAKLKPEGDYITPNQIASSPPPKTREQKEEYHTYFVLEKDNEQIEPESK